MNKRRLLVLAEKLSTVPNNQFDITHWMDHTLHQALQEGREPPCGTSACAAGWAATIPAFREAGFTARCGGPVLRKNTGPGTLYGDAALMKFFGLTQNQVDSVFYQEGYSETYLVTPKRVAAKIRRMVSRAAASRSR